MDFREVWAGRQECHEELHVLCAKRVITGRLPGLSGAEHREGHGLRVAMGMVKGMLLGRIRSWARSPFCLGDHVCNSFLQKGAECRCV